jgi:mannose-6-phosphate isomerase-like protein (cupin superfamily)
MPSASQRSDAAYTICSVADVPDFFAGQYPGEMRFLGGPLGAEQVALTCRRMPPKSGGKGSYGHRHRTQEEVYLVLSGRLEFKLEDEVVEVGPMTAVRVAPGTTRSVWNGGDADALLLIASIQIEDLEGDVELVEDFWPAT